MEAMLVVPLVAAVLMLISILPDVANEIELEEMGYEF